MSRFTLTLICLLSSKFAAGQKVGPDSVTPADGFLVGAQPHLGLLTDDPTSRFFDLLRASYQTSERPFSFEETVDLSSVIARGYFVEAIPGRAISNKRRPEIPPIQTILLKLSASSVLKGDHQEFYLVEYIANGAMVSELNEKLYSRELLFLLRPAHTVYDSRDVEISASSRAAIELSSDRPIYNFTLRSSLFTLSATGGLASPIDISREFNELYTSVRSLDELASRIASIR